MKKIDYTGTCIEYDNPEDYKEKNSNKDKEAREKKKEL